MVNQIKTESRENSTRFQLRQLRAEGRIPATVYGENINSTSISVDQREVTNILRTNPNAVLQMEIPEQGKHPVMITEIQRDPVTRNIIHLDFHQINVKSKINVQVRIDIVGEAKGVSTGGVVQVVMNEMTVSCLPHNIPTGITVDVSDLDIGDTITVAEIAMPEEVEAVSEADEVVVSVLAPQVEEDAEDDAAEADDDEAAQDTDEEAAEATDE